MHKIEHTPKVLTIIGLILEGFAGAVALAMGLVFRWLLAETEFEEDFRAELFSEMGNTQDTELIIDLYMFFFNSIFYIGVIVFVVFIVNVYLFTKLLRGKFTEKQAKKVYLYQAIWGGFNLLFNQITGILYLVSGIQGFNKKPDKIEVREGI
ncbi:MAG: hypothetical protein QM489_04335 [Candidatus Izemoplasma sp.]